MRANNLPIVFSGRELCQMMRRHKITIRELARRIGVAQHRIRFRRLAGFTCVSTAVDWKQAIIGEYTPELQAEFRAWKTARDRECERRYEASHV